MARINEYLNMDLSAVDEPGRLRLCHRTNRRARASLDFVTRNRTARARRCARFGPRSALLPYNAAAFSNRLSPIAVEVNPTEPLVGS
jgi:hypothetical protein